MQSHPLPPPPNVLRCVSLFQGWRMRRYSWLSSALAAQRKSCLWALWGPHIQSMHLSWFLHHTVSAQILFPPFDTWCIYMILIFMCTVSPEKSSLILNLDPWPVVLLEVYPLVLINLNPLNRISSPNTRIFTSITDISAIQHLPCEFRYREYDKRMKSLAVLFQGVPPW